ncbi:MAG TPA: mechanosensitive ion channel domain-containing protein [Chitinophagales bacterium]|nr:mechanosensitive ion channel domain-containing protein [Chitinophagales bacterium]
MEEEILSQTYWQRVSVELYEMLITKGIEIAIAIVILFVGVFLIKKLSKVVTYLIIKRTEEVASGQFIGQTVKIILFIVLFLSVASQVGIQTTSFVAALGATGIAIGLALQGSLSNFAGGILILMFKPFRIGDSIESLGFYGKVVVIDILHTKLVTPDNKYVVLPNGQLANSSIVNSSRQHSRRSEFQIPVSYQQDIDEIRKLILGVLSKEPSVLESPEPAVLLTNFNEFNTIVTVRFWTRNGEQAATLHRVLEEVRPHLKHMGRSVELKGQNAKK